jgi:hypothetical protein
MIVAAAIRIGKLVCSVPRPGRHHDVIRACAKSGMPTPIGVMPGLEDEQGFIDHEGNFLSRKQAALHVVKCGQPLRSSHINHRLGLFSEDLW